MSERTSLSLPGPSASDAASDTNRRRPRVGIHIGQVIQPIPGGIGTVIELLCKKLPEHVDVVAFAAAPRSGRQQLLSKLPHGVEVRTIKARSTSLEYELWHRLRRPRVRLDVDLIHAPSLAVPPTTAPLVVSIYDVAFLRHPEAFTRHGVRFHERGLEMARRHAAAIITPSQFTRDELIREGFDATMIYPVPLALPTRPHDEWVTRQLPHTPGVVAPYILMVGTIEPRKDHATLLAAFRRVRSSRPDVSLVIAGASGWLRQRCSSHLSAPGVVAVGPVSDAQLELLYRNATVVVSTSLYEGFGLPVLEALARGRPVIASAIPAHKELVADSARLFPPRDSDALALELTELLDDPSARDILSNAALRRAQHFTAMQTIAGHLAAYDAAMT